MSYSNSSEERIEKLVAFLIASVTIVAAVVTFLQTYTSGKANEADRTATQYAIQAMEARTSGETQVSHEWEGAYQTWYELDLQRMAADLSGDTAL
jgi:Tfp pilus assembly protein PilV